ncbi:MAG: hypothetical protein DRJ42_27520, partial [Deltaproteobacteria bacterium]
HEHYDRAFVLYADGAYVEAQALLEEVLAACPDYRGAADLLRHAGERAARPAAHLGNPSAVPSAAANYGNWEQIPAPPATAAAAGAVAAGFTGDWEQPPVDSPAVATGEGEQDSDLARVELSIVEGLMGAFHGIWICGWVDDGCDEKGLIGLSIGGAAVFAGTAAALTWDGITMGQGTAIETGTFFGSWLGTAAWMAAGAPGDSFSSDDSWVPIFSVAFGGLAGTVAGSVLAVTAVPDSGRVALAASGGLWGGMLGLLISIIPDTYNYPPEAFGASQLIGVPLGMIAGIVGGSVHRTSRGRMFLVDLGALLGGALGVAGAVLTSDGSDFAQHVGAWSAILLPVGFGVTMWLTASLDVPDEVADHVSITPAGPGDGPGLTVSVRF